MPALTDYCWKYWARSLDTKKNLFSFDGYINLY